jgi:hypothetical protein
VSWGWDFVGSSRSGAMLDDPEQARIDWGDEDELEAAVAGK